MREEKRLRWLLLAVVIAIIFVISNANAKPMAYIKGEILEPGGSHPSSLFVAIYYESELIYSGDAEDYPFQYNMWGDGRYGFNESEHEYTAGYYTFSVSNQDYRGSTTCYFDGRHIVDDCDIHVYPHKHYMPVE